MAGFEYEEHTADVKVHVIGADFADALRHAARACTNLLTPVEYVEKKIERAVSIRADSDERMVFLFLEELVYILDTVHFVACDAKLQVKNGQLIGKLWGDSTANYERHGDIKAPTKHGLKVSAVNGQVEIEFVLDI